MNSQMEPLPRSEQGSDVRVQATAKIWLYSVALMGVAIPITAITKSTMIPMMVVIGPALATLAVWYFGARDGATASVNPPDNKAQIAAQQRIEELEERLANLETINNYERRLAEEDFRRANDKTNVKATKDALSQSELNGKLAL